MTLPPPERDSLFREAVKAVAEAYDHEGQEIWWRHHDKQTPEEQERLQRLIIQANDGNV